ncbi:MAG: 2-hydroxychromene-2-carboxylate isomerase [Ancalomicrobiaceae bacterium]|nr:2-hydroxychromene-2-carboxylate isomerase [Ancalomicrobiaceae bacterium]
MGRFDQPVLDFWYEFASTYSYVAAMRIEAMASRHSVVVRWRPFLLGPIFSAQGWTTSPFNLYPAKGRYMWRDVERLCRDFELAFRRPREFPQNSLLAARLALIGAAEGWGEAFAKAVFVAEFGEGREISRPEALGPILTALGLDAGALLARARTDEAVKSRLKSATEEAQSLGIFGAPNFVTEDGELFWGNDRMDEAFAWAAGQGQRPARMPR